MNKMHDDEIRQMVAFKLHQTVRYIAELEQHASNSETRTAVARARAAVLAAVDLVWAPTYRVIGGDDERRPTGR